MKLLGEDDNGAGVDEQGVNDGIGATVGGVDGGISEGG